MHYFEPMSKMIRSDKLGLIGASLQSTESKSIHPLGSKNSYERSDFYAIEGQVSRNIESFGSDIGFFHVHENADGSEPAQQLQHFEEFGCLEDLRHDIYSPLLQSGKNKTWITDMIGNKNRQPNVYPGASFDVLRKHGSRRLKFDEKISGTGNGIPSPQGAVSTEMIIQLAAEKFIQSTTQSSNNLSVLSHPYLTSVLKHSEEDSKGVQLIQNLLCCAEKVGEKQHERSIKFLKECDKLSSPTGTPIHRLAFYFSEALLEKIAIETGRIRPKGLEPPLDPLEPVICPKILVAFHNSLPHPQITKFVGIQAIVDHLEEAIKVHVIDFQIRSGVQWIILMQALAARTKHPIQYLKLTVVGTKAKPILEDIGRQLANFAESLDLKFIFRTVMVENILHLREDDFEREAGEAVAVYAAYTFVSMIGRSSQIEHVMGVIKNTSPCVMVVTESEVNCNAPTFIGRFVESLFYFGAYFDTLSDCMKNDETNRAYVESTLFRSSIRDVLAAEGEERKVRHMNINVWRAFFTRFGLVEVELSLSALDQATVALQGFPCKNSCSLHMDGKCLIIGWKGTPLVALSVWEFK